MPSERVDKAHALLALTKLENLIDDADAEDVEDMPRLCQVMRNELATVRRFVVDAKAEDAPH